LGTTIMTNTRVKFFFTASSERECYVYVERGKGFTEAKPFPGRSNPWLKDLGAEEFAYHVRLAWPLEQNEYTDREEMLLPAWSQIPGQGRWQEREQHAQELPPPVEEPSDALPRPFPLVRDKTWEEQVQSIRAVFTEADPNRSDRDESIDRLRSFQ